MNDADFFDHWTGIKENDPTNGSRTSLARANENVTTTTINTINNTVIQNEAEWSEESRRIVEEHLDQAA